MGIPLTHSAEGKVGWTSDVDGNWTTLEASYLARQKSDTSVVTVTGTTSETVLMANTTIPANALAVGTVIPVWAAGNFLIPANTAATTITFNLRWGGLAGVQIDNTIYNTVKVGSAQTVEWVFDDRLCCVTTGASGTLMLESWAAFSDSNQFFTGVTTGTATIDTTTAKLLVWTVTLGNSAITATQRQMVTDRG